MLRSWLWLIPCSLLTLCPAAQAGPFADALRAMADHDPGRATSLLDDLIGPGKPLSDQAGLLEARAQFLAGHVARAAEIYRRLLKSARPGSEVILGARFGLAECLAKQGKFAEAEKNFAWALERLSSEAMRLQTAERFVRLAEEALKPAAGEGEPNPARAERLYRAALDLELPAQRALEIQLKLGQSLTAQKRHAEAARHYLDLLKSKQLEDSALRPEVRLLAAQDLLKAGDRIQARRTLRDLLADSPQSRQAAQASYLLSRTHGMPTPGNATELARGTAALKRFLKRYPNHKKAAEARLELALAPMHLGRQADAEDALRAILKSDAPTELMADARHQLGVCLAAQGRYDEAAAAWAAYLKHHAAHKFWSAARAGIEEVDWQKAQAARAEERWADAAQAFTAFAERHPAVARAPEAMFRAAEAHLEAKQPDRALAMLTTLTSKFAGQGWGYQGLLLTGRIYEEHKAEFAKAREAYKEADKPGSPVIAQARSRLALMDEPSLLVESPENFRANQHPELTWHVRNIEKVAIRAFRIQAEDFFRDRMGMDDLTAMDIALCEPDRSWTVEVPGYKRHARIEQKVPLPLDRPGLYLLNLSAGDLEATTAVRVSDMGLMVKVGAGEVFTFVSDRRRQRPWKGAKVLVADGAKLLAEGTTAADGTFRFELAEDADATTLTVFVHDGDQLAWAGQADPPLNRPSQRSPRAFVFSERPAYRPGDQVHLAGIYRGVRDGAYAFSAGQALKLRVSDPSGSVLFDAPVELDDYGTFHHRLDLDPAAREGHYNFFVQAKDGPSFSGSFQVREHRRLPFDLSVQLDRAVLIRGERLSGLIRVRHPHGAPAADQEVSYLLEGEAEVHTGRTDAAGELRFDFPTRAYEAATRLTVKAHLTRGHLVAEAQAVLSVAAFELSIEVDERTLFAGQPFDVRVRATRPDGKPAAADITLEATRRHPRAGGEVRVWSKPVSLGADGLRATRVNLADKGTHILRATGLDRAGNPVVAERLIELVGDEEPGIWLDVTDDKQVPGRPAEIVIHSRLPRTLLLLTAETERVLTHRSLVIEKGANKLELPIDAKLAPNFLLAAAAMDGDRLHRAARSVQVSQELSIQVRPDKQAYGPGEEVTLTLVVTDKAGRPADARLLVSVVDAALLKAFPENLPALLQTFHVLRPEGTVKTSASAPIRFPAVEAEQVEQAEVREAEGSAAMAALKSRRRVMTEAAIGEFGELTGGEVGGVGGLGVAGYGSGAGGLAGRSYRSPRVMMGRAGVMGGKDARWRRSFEETAIFAHDVRTGPDGVASVVFRLPDSITRWQVTARGVTRQTQLGEARRELVVRRAFFAELQLPAVIEHGDTFQPVARVFNHTLQAQSVALELSGPFGKRTAQLELGPGRSGEHLFEPIQTQAQAGPLKLALRAVAGDYSDAQEREVPMRPRGVRVANLAEGLIGDPVGGQILQGLELAAGLTEPRLEIRASDRLVRFFIGDRLDPLLFGDRPEEALVALELLELLGPSADATMTDLVQARLRRALIHLQSVQDQSGSWGWSRGAAHQSLEASTAGLRALARARPLAGKLGWPFPQNALDRAAGWLAPHLQSLPPDAFGQRAEVLYALAHLGRDKVPTVALQRMHRLRGSLPIGAQALLGLTWLQLGRPEQAREVAAVLAKGPLFDPLRVSLIERWLPIRSLSDVDRLRALALLAQVSPNAPVVARGRTWLLGRSRFIGWDFPRQSAAALGALRHMLAVGHKGKHARIKVKINGKPGGQISLSGDGAVAHLDVDPGLLAEGENRIELALEGSGAAWYQARLSGYRLAPPAPAEDDPIRIKRHIEPVPQAYRGKPIQAGFSPTTGSTKRWINQIDALPAGGRIQVTLEIERDFARPLDHCSLLERIPAGFELEEGSAEGQLTHLRVDGRRLAFYLASAGKHMRIAYRLVAVTPGSYRFAPSRLVSLANPGTTLLGPTSSFQVRAPSADRPKVRPTPLELYQRGMAAADQDDPAAAIQNLEALWEGFELATGFTDPVLEKLLFAAIETDDPPRILKYFELAKEKNPSLVIPFDKLEPVQRAYRAQKAYEGGLHLARGLTEALFVRQLRAVGVLESLDELAEAMDLLRRLLTAYPDNQLTAKAAYAFSQVIYGRADRIAAGEELKGFDRPGLLDEVADLMAGFLGRHPDHPEAPAAIFSLASAQIERDRPDRAIAWCAVGLAQHSQSDLAPALAYLKAFAHFRRGEYGPSLKLCDRVAAEAKDPSHVDMARYIMAQIHHARGQIAAALPLYRQVAERFVDADETVRELEQAWFKVPEVVRVARGKRAKLEVTARNLTSLDLRAYRVDLLKLYLLKRSLSDLADVNLAGIKPIFQRRVRLRAAQGAGPTEQVVDLALPGKGAYLVLSRGGSRVAPSLVLIDALELEVTEVVEEGRVRVAVRDARSRPLAGARVQLKGSENQRFTVGHTDLRGIFIGDEIAGAVTVIAVQRGSYGLYRGTQQLELAPEDSGYRRRPRRKQRNDLRQVIDFDESNIEGQLNQPSPSAIEFFNQDVKGMSVEQAK